VFPEDILNRPIPPTKVNRLGDELKKRMPSPT